MRGPAVVAAALGSKRGSLSYLENLEIFRKWFDTPLLQLAGKLGRRIEERLRRTPPPQLLVGERLFCLAYGSPSSSVESLGEHDYICKEGWMSCSPTLRKEQLGGTKNGFILERLV